MSHPLTSMWFVDVLLISYGLYEPGPGVSLMGFKLLLTSPPKPILMYLLGFVNSSWGLYVAPAGVTYALLVSKKLKSVVFTFVKQNDPLIFHLWKGWKMLFYTVKIDIVRCNTFFRNSLQTILVLYRINFLVGGTIQLVVVIFKGFSSCFQD